VKSCLEGSSTICLKSLRKGKLTSNIINLYLTNYERIISPFPGSIDDHALSTASEWMPHTLNANDLYLTNYERIISPSPGSIDDHALSTASEWTPHTLNANDLNSLDGPMLAISVAEDEEIIDIDTFEYEDTIEKLKASAPACKGFLLTFPETKSPNTAYPFALHDTLILPWDYTLKNSVMSLFTRSCTGLSGGEG
jgi:hypothetical protein